MDYLKACDFAVTQIDLPSDIVHQAVDRVGLAEAGSREWLRKVRAEAEEMAMDWGTLG